MFDRFVCLLHYSIDYSIVSLVSPRVDTLSKSVITVRLKSFPFDYRYDSI